MAGRPPDDLVAAFSRDMDLYSTAELAELYNRAERTIRDWRRWVKQRALQAVPESGAEVLEGQIVLPDEPVIVVSDLEIPYHHAETLNRAIQVGRYFGVKTLILNGDVFALDQFTTWLQEVAIKTSLRHDLSEAGKVLEALLTAFGRVVMVTGNHEARLPRAVTGEVTIGDLLAAITSGKVEFSEYHWCQVGESWMVVHPDNYSKVPLSVARELASIHLKNVLVAHVHHLGMCFHKSGQLICVDGGCATDPTRRAYKRLRVTRHPEWNLGFVMIRNGWPYIFSTERYDWAFLEGE